MSNTELSSPHVSVVLTPMSAAAQRYSCGVMAAFGRSCLTYKYRAAINEPLVPKALMRFTLKEQQLARTAVFLFGKSFYSENKLQLITKTQDNWLKICQLLKFELTLIMLMFSFKFAFSCIPLNRTGVEKLGDTCENSSDHFDFSRVSDTIRDYLSLCYQTIKNCSPMAGLELRLRSDDNNKYESLFFPPLPSSCLISILEVWIFYN